MGIGMEMHDRDQKRRAYWFAIPPSRFVSAQSGRGQGMGSGGMGAWTWGMGIGIRGIDR